MLCVFLRSGTVRPYDEAAEDGKVITQREMTAEAILRSVTDCNGQCDCGAGTAGRNELVSQFSEWEMP
jgi:hypothetical protein